MLLNDSVEFENYFPSVESELVDMKMFHNIRLSDIWIRRELLPNRQLPIELNKDKPIAFHTLEKPGPISDSLCIYKETDVYDTDSRDNLWDSLEEVYGDLEKYKMPEFVKNRGDCYSENDEKVKEQLFYSQAAKSIPDLLEYLRMSDSESEELNDAGNEYFFPSTVEASTMTTSYEDVKVSDTYQYDSVKNKHFNLSSDVKFPEVKSDSSCKIDCTSASFYNETKETDDKILHNKLNKLSNELSLSSSHSEQTKECQSSNSDYNIECSAASFYNEARLTDDKILHDELNELLNLRNENSSDLNSLSNEISLSCTDSEEMKECQHTNSSNNIECSTVSFYNETRVTGEKILQDELNELSNSRNEISNNLIRLSNELSLSCSDSEQSNKYQHSNSGYNIDCTAVSFYNETMDTDNKMLDGELSELLISRNENCHNEILNDFPNGKNFSNSDSERLKECQISELIESGNLILTPILDNESTLETVVKNFPISYQRPKEELSHVLNDKRRSKKEKRMKQKSAISIPLDSIFLSKQQAAEANMNKFMEGFQNKMPNVNLFSPEKSSASVASFPSLPKKCSVGFVHYDKKSDDQLSAQEFSDVATKYTNESIFGKINEDYDADNWDYNDHSKLVIENIPTEIDEEAVKNLILPFGNIMHISLKKCENSSEARIIMECDDLNWVIDCLNDTQPFGGFSCDALKCYWEDKNKEEI